MGPLGLPMCPSWSCHRIRKPSWISCWHLLSRSMKQTIRRRNPRSQAAHGLAHPMPKKEKKRKTAVMRRVKKKRERVKSTMRRKERVNTNLKYRSLSKVRSWTWARAVQNWQMIGKPKMKPKTLQELISLPWTIIVAEKALFLWLLRKTPKSLRADLTWRATHLD